MNCPEKRYSHFECFGMWHPSGQKLLGGDNHVVAHAHPRTFTSHVTERSLDPPSLSLIKAWTVPPPALVVRTVTQRNAKSPNELCMHETGRMEFGSVVRNKS